MAVAISEKKLSLHEFIGLVEQYPDRKFKLNAAGDAVEMSPSRSHGILQGWICGLLQGWLSPGVLPGYWAGTEITHDLDGLALHSGCSCAVCGRRALPARGAAGGG